MLPSSSLTTVAQPSITCSQLSSSSSDESGNRLAIVADAEPLDASAGSTATAIACATDPGSTVCDRSTHQPPSTKSARTASASAIASLVFPAPPGPDRVSNRPRHTSALSSLSASSRPISSVSCGGRFPSAISPSSFPPGSWSGLTQPPPRWREATPTSRRGLHLYPAGESLKTRSGGLKICRPPVNKRSASARQCAKKWAVARCAKARLASGSSVPAGRPAAGRTDISPEVAQMKIRIRSASLALLTASVFAIGLARTLRQPPVRPRPSICRRHRSLRHCSWPATSPA